MGTTAIMPVACGGVAVVLRLQRPEPVPLRASVGSTEAAKDVVARFGVIDRSIGEPPCARRCRRTEVGRPLDNS